MLQVAARAWPARAVHDTVAAVMRTEPFQRSVQTTLLERMLGWFGQFFAWLSRYVGRLPAGRTVAIWAALLVAALVVARVLIAARAGDPHAGMRGEGETTDRHEDPWRAAERLAAAGDHEAAAHAIYRGVLASVARNERLRLDPSKTSGDYARELRARGSAAYQPFRAFARRFDDAVYGHGPIDRALTSDLVRLAAPLRAGARAA